MTSVYLVHLQVTNPFGNSELFYKLIVLPEVHTPYARLNPAYGDGRIDFLILDRLQSLRHEFLSRRRQDSDRFLRRFACYTSPIPQRIGCIVNPVSYTHLDVYKRQQHFIEDLPG